MPRSPARRCHAAANSWWQPRSAARGSNAPAAVVAPGGALVAPPLGRVPVGTLGIQLAHRISFQVDAVGGVHAAVTYRAADGGLADDLMPGRYRQLRDHQRPGATVAIFKHLQQGQPRSLASAARQRPGTRSGRSTGPLGRGDALHDHTQQFVLEAQHLTLQRSRIEAVELTAQVLLGLL